MIRLFVILFFFSIFSLSASARHPYDFTSDKLETDDHFDVNDIFIKNLFTADKINKEKLTYFFNPNALKKEPFSEDIKRIKFSSFTKTVTFFSSKTIYQRPDIYSHKHRNDNIESSENKVSYYINKGQITANLPDDNGLFANYYTAHFSYYHSHALKSHPLVVIFPPIVGETMVDSSIAKTFALNNINALIIEFSNVLSPDIETDKVGMLPRKNTIITNILIDYFIYEYPKSRVDENRIGSFGISLGACRAARLLGVNPKVKFAWIILGGGNIGDILINSEQEQLEKYRNARFEIEEKFRIDKLKFTITNPSARDIENERKRILLEIMQANTLFSEPLTYAKNMFTDNVYMIIGINDSIIPTRNQIELWQALGEPSYELSRLPHIATVVRWYIHNHGDVLKFFKNKFELF